MTTSRIPPSRRDPEYAPQRSARAVATRTPGTGRVSAAAPNLSGDIAALLRGRPSGGAATAEVPSFYRDRYPTTTGTLSTNLVTATLTFTPVSGSLHLYVDGVLLDEGTDYTLSGATVTFAGTPAASGTVLEARYAYVSGSTAGTPGTESYNYDYFTRADSTTSIGGSGWVVHGGTWGISSNRAYLVSMTGGSVMAINQYVVRRNAGYSSVDLTVRNYRGSTGGASSLLFGYDPTANDGYLLNFDASAGATVYVRRVGAGSPYQVGGDANPTAWGGSSTVLRVTFDSATGDIEVFQNGVSFYTVTDPSPFTGGTWVGMGTNQPSAWLGGEFWDDFGWAPL